METLVGEIIPVVTEKYEFDCRGKLKKNTSLNFLNIGSMMEGSKVLVVNRLILRKG